MKLLRPVQAAEFLGLTRAALAYRRKNGVEPKYIRLSSRAVRYRLEDLEEFVVERVVELTANFTPIMVHADPLKLLAALQLLCWYTGESKGHDALTRASEYLRRKGLT